MNKDKNILKSETDLQYYVFTDGYEEGVEGMIQLSNSFSNLEQAKRYCERWNSKNTYIMQLIKR